MQHERGSRERCTVGCVGSGPRLPRAHEFTHKSNGLVKHAATCFHQPHLSQHSSFALTHPVCPRAAPPAYHVARAGQTKLGNQLARVGLPVRRQDRVGQGRAARATCRHVRWEMMKARWTCAEKHRKKKARRGQGGVGGRIYVGLSEAGPAFE